MSLPRACSTTTHHGTHTFMQMFICYSYTHTHTQLNVRSLKAGLRLVSGVAALGRKCANAFIKHGVIDRLTALLVADTMASSLKLLALKALDGLTDYPQGMEQLLGWSTGTESCDSGYQTLLQLAFTKPVSVYSKSIRICVTVTVKVISTASWHIINSLTFSDYFMKLHFYFH